MSPNLELLLTKTKKQLWQSPNGTFLLSGLIQLNVAKVYQYSEEHGESFLRKVDLMSSYVFLSGTAFYLAVFFDTNTQIHKCPLPHETLTFFSFGLP
jgi:hypothetical protein